MIKKILILLTLLMPTLASAQMAAGEWYLYPSYDFWITRMIETPGGKLYYTAAQSLFSYDRNTGEQYAYSMRNLLNDKSIKSISYNYDSRYLLVIYDNCNMDMIYDSGDVANLSDVKSAIMMSDKSINDVAFYKGRIYLATSFGMVVYDEKGHFVVESGDYAKEFVAINVHGGKIVLHAKDYSVYVSDIDKPHYTLDSFTKCNYGRVINRFFNTPDSEEWFYGLCNADNVVRRIKVNADATDLQMENISQTGNNLVDGFCMADGSVSFLASDYATIYNVKSGEVIRKVTVPQNVAGTCYATYKDPARVWTYIYRVGVGLYDLSSSTPTTLVAPSQPEACNVPRVAYLTPSLDRSNIYVSTIGPSHYKNISYSRSWTLDGSGDYAFINVISNGQLHDITPWNVPAVVPHTITRQNELGNKLIIAPTHVAQDPFDPTVYYNGSYSEGVYKMRHDGTCIGVYNHLNSPMKMVDGSGPKWGGIFVSGLNVDPDGDLYVAWVDNTTSDYGMRLSMLPAAKVAMDPAKVTASDWVDIGLAQVEKFYRDTEIVACRNSPMVFMLSGYYYTKLLAYNRQTGDSYIWSSLTDQDGKEFSLGNCTSVVEDNEGKVWIGGYSTGVLILDNSTDYTNRAATARRAKVPRNDGTNYADYLMEIENVTCISVDPSNRKWFATENSGLYLVSADGQEILDQFTSENSQLPDNQVNAVFADALSNKVYVGTNYGLAVYSSDSSPASEDYSEVYAYPNPVRPEYTGWITVNGLMENSLVKIGDALGNILATGNSQGGMFMWDGCDTHGNRVKSGVYYVYASQNPESGSKGAVACKILVVN